MKSENSKTENSTAVNSLSEQDVDLTSLLYLTGELTEQQQVAFEELMTTSQVAREALADNFLLIQATQTLEREERVSELAPSYQESVSAAPVESTTTNQTRVSWMLIGIAASVLVMFSTQIFITSFQTNLSNTTKFSAEIQDLAELWLDTTVNDQTNVVSEDLAVHQFDDLDDDLIFAESEFAISDFPQTNLDSTNLVTAPFSEEQEQAAAPDWMLFAVSLTSDSEMESGMSDLNMETMDSSRELEFTP